MEAAGWWWCARCDDCKPYWSRVEIPTGCKSFFLLIFVYKLTSTNSYILWRLYQFVHFYVIFVYKLTSTNYYILWRLYQFVHFYVINVWIRTFFIQIRTYEFIEQAARAKPEHTSCPDQAAPGCPDVRVHPAAPTLGYTRLPRPVRVRSWGGWVRNGIKITISKMRLYKFIRHSQPLMASEGGGGEVTTSQLSFGLFWRESKNSSFPSLRREWEHRTRKNSSVS